MSITYPRNGRIHLCHILYTALAMATAPALTQASWPGDPTVNVPVSTAIGEAVSSIKAVPDGAGGVICAWSDDLGGDSNVYAQHIDSQGNTLWMPDGLPICTASLDQTLSGIIPDGTGGVIMVWKDLRSGNFDVYGQRIDATGNILWTTDGLRLVTGPFPAIAGGTSMELLRSSVAGELWTSTFNPSFENINGASMVLGYFAAVCGDNGTILHSTDGGMTWQVLAELGPNLYDIDLRSGSQGLAVGAGGNVARWNGTQWSPQGQVVFDTLRGVSHANGMVAVAVGDNGNVIRTVDGGTIWQIQSSGTSDALHGVDFADPSVVVAVGVNGTMVRSSDGGAFWSAVVSGTAQALHGVAFLDPNVAVAVGTAGTILRSTDAGLNWNVVTSPTSDELNDVAFEDNGEGLAVGDNGTIIMTKDGGLTWAPVSSGVTTALEGVALANIPANRSRIHAVSDDVGGVILGWTDSRFGDHDVFALRIDGDGNRVWFDDVAVNAATGDQGYLAMTRNGFGGAYFGWAVNGDLFAQGVDASGTLMFAGPTAVCTATGDQYELDAALDSEGGVVFVWLDDRDGFFRADMYAQRVLPSGFIYWVPGGMLLCNTSGGQLVQVRRLDFSSMIMTWNIANTIYAQRVFLDGTIVWQNCGVPISDALPTSTFQTTVPDGSGGAVIIMQDDREGTSDIYVAIVDGDGTLRREETPVAIGPGNRYAVSAVSDNAGGAIALFEDTRNDLIDETNEDVYAQNIDRHGYIGTVAASITTVVDVPNDQGGKATVSWSPSYLDAFPEQTITDYTVWRRNEASVFSAPSKGTPGGYERAVAAGVLEELVATMAASGWVYLDQVPALYLEEYGYDAPTYGDSTEVTVPLTGFQIIAHTDDPFVFWASQPATGYSVDNLAPSSPLSLGAQLAGADIDLDWSPGTGSDPDFSHYEVYHDLAPGVIAGAMTFLDATTDTFYTHTGPPPGTHYYVVIAVDEHDNDSAPSNEASAEVVTAVHDGSNLSPNLTVLPGSPNPFSDATTLRFGVPERGEVTIEVFDVLGRRVFAERVDTPAAGWYTRRFSARDDDGQPLASGVYFYRVTTMVREARTQKLVIMR